MTEPVDPHADCGSNAYKQVHCDRCGRDFTCVPWDDFYCAVEGDHCCERCLIGDRKLVVMPESEIQPDVIYAPSISGPMSGLVTPPRCRQGHLLADCECWRNNRTGERG